MYEQAIDYMHKKARPKSGWNDFRKVKGVLF